MTESTARLLTFICKLSHTLVISKLLLYNCMVSFKLTLRMLCVLSDNAYAVNPKVVSIMNNNPSRMENYKQKTKKWNTVQTKIAIRFSRFIRTHKCFFCSAWNSCSRCLWNLKINFPLYLLSSMLQLWTWHCSTFSVYAYYTWIIYFKNKLSEWIWKIKWIFRSGNQFRLKLRFWSEKWVLIIQINFRWLIILVGQLFSLIC